MRNKSHAAMGRYLLREYLPGLPRPLARIFLVGCTQPDKNPTTYLKGSLRSQWMRGHNYGNAHRYMVRLIRRLEGKQRFNAWDFYSLGKLMHYTMDAFTLPHNENFPQELRSHRSYEVRLQHCFLGRIHRAKKPEAVFLPALELIRRSHAQYLRTPGNMDADCAYAFRTCCQLMQILTEKIGNCQDYTFPFGAEDDILTAYQTTESR